MTKRPRRRRRTMTGEWDEGKEKERSTTSGGVRIRSALSHWWNGGERAISEGGEVGNKELSNLQQFVNKENEKDEKQIRDWCAIESEIFTKYQHMWPFTSSLNDFEHTSFMALQNVCYSVGAIFRSCFIDTFHQAGFMPALHWLFLVLINDKKISHAMFCTLAIDRPQIDFIKSVC